MAKSCQFFIHLHRKKKRKRKKDRKKERLKLETDIWLNLLFERAFYRSTN